MVWKWYRTRWFQLSEVTSVKETYRPFKGWCRKWRNQWQPHRS